MLRQLLKILKHYLVEYNEHFTNDPRGTFFDDLEDGRALGRLCITQEFTNLLHSCYYVANSLKRGN